MAHDNPREFEAAAQAAFPNLKWRADFKVCTNTLRLRGEHQALLVTAWARSPHGDWNARGEQRWPLSAPVRLWQASNFADWQDAVSAALNAMALTAQLLRGVLGEPLKVSASPEITDELVQRWGHLKRAGAALEVLDAEPEPIRYADPTNAEEVATTLRRWFDLGVIGKCRVQADPELTKRWSKP